MRLRLRSVPALWILTLAISAQASIVEAADVVVLVNGSFNAYPPWVAGGSPESQAIASTFGVQPVHFAWTDNDSVYPPYSGIFNGGLALANFIDGLGLGSGDNLNIVAHSHGGNVALIASYYLSNRPYRHLINLGTPVNFDLPGLGGSGAYSHCQISSYSDWTQFYGASPSQVYLYFEAQYWAGIYSSYAYEAQMNGQWDDYWYYSSLMSYYQSLAEYAFISTKYEPGAGNVLFSGLSHSDLHEPPVWYAIAPSCALN